MKSRIFSKKQVLKYWSLKQVLKQTNSALTSLGRGHLINWSLLLFPGQLFQKYFANVKRYLTWNCINKGIYLFFRLIALFSSVVLEKFGEISFFPHYFSFYIIFCFVCLFLFLINSYISLVVPTILSHLDPRSSAPDIYAHLTE